MPLFRVVLLCCLSVLSWRSVADTLWLDNGDRLTGKVAFLEGGKLVLETDFAG
ncbi:MAG TPA: DUF481 domain-containing protein, partial [Pseudomonas sp.]|nr:DUF481 domain-containing protein [Pseudomonas sp.]